MKPRIRKPLRKGTLVYHGTSSEEDFTDLNGPAWVSGAEAVARNFVDWAGGRGRPRVLVFRVATAPSLAVAESTAEFKSFAEWVAARAAGVVDLSDMGPFDESIPADAFTAIGTGLAESLCNARLGIDGWHIPRNYDDGDDTMLCEPERFLEFVRVIEVEERRRPWVRK